MAGSLEVGDRIRIGADFETVVVEGQADGGETDEGDAGGSFEIRDGWQSESAGEYSGAAWYSRGSPGCVSAHAARCLSRSFLRRASR